MANPKRGEVWLLDLGLKAKRRPCLVVSVMPGDRDRNLAALVCHTTRVRGSEYEIVTNCSFLNPGAFDAQDIYTIDKNSKVFVRKLGEIDTEQLQEVVAALQKWLGLSA